MDPERRAFKSPLAPENLKIVAPGLTSSGQEQMQRIIEHPFFGCLTPEGLTKGRDCYAHKYSLKKK